MENLESALSALPMWLQLGAYVLSSLVCVGYVYIKMTPNEDDDKWLMRMEQKPIVGPLLKTLKALSPVQRKSNVEKLK